MKTNEDLRKYNKEVAKTGVGTITLIGAFLLICGALLSLFRRPETGEKLTDFQVLFVYGLDNLTILLMLVGAVLIIIAASVYAYRSLPFRYRKMEVTFTKIENTLSIVQFSELENALYYIVKDHNEAEDIPTEEVNAFFELSTKVYDVTKRNFHHYGILKLVLNKIAREKGLI